MGDRSAFTEERHEALAQRPPASAFTLSPRRYPRPLLRFPVDAPWAQAARIDPPDPCCRECPRIRVSAMSLAAHERSFSTRVGRAVRLPCCRVVQWAYSGVARAVRGRAH